MNSLQINQKYLDQMYNAKPSDKVFSRIRDFWWPHFLSSYSKNPTECLDALDLCMDAGQERLRLAANDHAVSFGFKEGSKEHIQRVNQVLKSSTGKMFERFIGLAIAHALLTNKSKYSIWGFRSDLSKFSTEIEPKNFEVSMMLSGREFSTPVDADLLVFDPTKCENDVYMISVKSTLKDRFHNVPFWNLVRALSLSQSNDCVIQKITPKNGKRLSSAKYVSVCSDLANEQPDFGSEDGPRNLLCFDAILLDGAYVTASRAKGVKRSKNHFGNDRAEPFSPLSCFVEMLC